MGRKMTRQAPTVHATHPGGKVIARSVMHYDYPTACGLRLAEVTVARERNEPVTCERCLAWRKRRPPEREAE
jgi:hypothetical protein